MGHGENLLDVLGVEISDVSMERAVELLLGIMTAKVRTPHTVYFVNAHTLNVATEDPDYRALLGRGSYVFGDGTGVRWAARMLYGKELRGNVNGTDLTPRLFEAGRDRGLRYYLLGNTEERIARAARFTQDQFPGWTLAGFHHGYVSAADDARIVETINAARPDLLFVGMGNPLQERWLDRNVGALEVPLCMGTGGLFDYWSGDLERAPGWVRGIGYEWLHLLIRQPRKFRRYVLGNPQFLARVARQRAGV